MITIAVKKEPCELFRNYLKSGYSVFSKMDDAGLEKLITTHAIKKGLYGADDYVNKAFTMPFQDMMRELKALCLKAYPLVLYRHKGSWDELNRLVLEKGIWGEEIFEHKKSLIMPTKPVVLNVLEAETATGEGIYTTIMKMRKILAKSVKFNLLAMDSDEELLKRAQQNSFSPDRMKNVPDTDLSLNFKQFDGENYSLVSEYTNMIKFLKMDLLKDDLSIFKDRKYFFVNSDNLAILYPRAVCRRIVEKIIPYMMLEGIMFLHFPDGEYMEFEGLDLLQGEGFQIYQRNRKPFKTKYDVEIQRRHDSLEGIIAYIDYLVSRRQYKKAIQEMQKITRKRPKSIILLHLLGDLHLINGQNDEAYRRYKTAWSRNRGFLPSLFNMVILDLINGNQEEAQKKTEGMLQKLNTADERENEYGRGFNLTTRQINDYCRQLTDAVENRDSLALESLILDVIGEQKIYNIIPFQTGVFKSLLTREPSLTPTRMESRPQIAFLQGFSEEDLKKMMNKKERSRRPEDLIKSGMEPRDEKPAPESGEEPVEAEEPAGSEKARSASTSIDDAMVSARPRAPRRREIEKERKKGKFYTTGIPREFVETLEKLIDDEDYHKVFRYLNKVNQKAGDAQKDVARVIAKLSVTARKYKDFHEKVADVSENLNALLSEGY